MLIAVSYDFNAYVALLSFIWFVQVYVEIMAVLEHDDKSTRRLEDSASDLSQLSTQTVFSMLDHLTQWARHKFQILTSEKSASKSSKDRGDLKSEWCLFCIKWHLYSSNKCFNLLLEL